MEKKTTITISKKTKELMDDVGAEGDYDSCIRMLIEDREDFLNNKLNMYDTDLLDKKVFIYLFF